MAGIDLDNGTHDFGNVQLDEGTFEGTSGDWHGSALDRAGMVYKRMCKWDSPPGETGIWLMILAPVSSSGGGEGPWYYSGRLAGFVVLYDRDKDGAYESVATSGLRQHGNAAGSRGGY